MKWEIFDQSSSFCKSPMTRRHLSDYDIFFYHAVLQILSIFIIEVIHVIFNEIDALFHQLSHNNTSDCLPNFATFHTNCSIIWYVEQAGFNSGYLIDNFWTITCQFMAVMKKLHVDLINNNLYVDSMIHFS